MNLSKVARTDNEHFENVFQLLSILHLTSVLGLQCYICMKIDMYICSIEFCRFSIIKNHRKKNATAQRISPAQFTVSCVSVIM